MLAGAGGTWGGRRRRRGARAGCAGCVVVVAGGSVLLLLGARPVAGARGRPSRRLGVGAEGGGDVGAAGAACKGLRYTKAEARAVGRRGAGVLGGASAKADKPREALSDYVGGQRGQLVEHLLKIKHQSLRQHVISSARVRQEAQRPFVRPRAAAASPPPRLNSGQ